MNQIIRYQSLLRGRCIHTSTCLFAKNRPEDKYKLLLDFPVPNVAGQWDPKHIPEHLFDDYFNYPMHRDPLKTQHPGYWFRRRFVPVKEMEPELIVPDLTGFNLKPYVSYRTTDVFQTEFDARALFNRVYGVDIIAKYTKGEEIKVEINEEDVAEAELKALQTGADLFCPTHQELYEADAKKDQS